MHLRKPVLIVVFKRPDLTSKLLETLARVQPPRLYIAADAARPHKPGEAEKCAEVRQLLENIPWPCEVFRDYASTNMGSKGRVASAITWLFQHETDGIIVEDDCHPDDSFFPYCEELLDRYADDERVMCISGDRGVRDDLKIEESYYFSKYMLTWGWATWRRAWAHYDESMAYWPEFKGARLRAHCLADDEAEYWSTRIERVLRGELDAWDFRWTMACFKNNGVSCVPARNLVRNLGFNAEATHTKDDLLGNFSYETSPMTFPMKHPAEVRNDASLDLKLWKTKFKPAGLLKRVRRKLILLSRAAKARLRPSAANTAAPALQGS